MKILTSLVLFLLFWSTSFSQYVGAFEAMEKGDFETTLLRFEENYSRPGGALTNGLCGSLFRRAIKGNKNAMEFLEYGESKNTVITSNFKAPLLLAKLNFFSLNQRLRKIKTKCFRRFILVKILLTCRHYFT